MTFVQTTTKEKEKKPLLVQKWVNIEYILKCFLSWIYSLLKFNVYLNFHFCRISTRVKIFKKFNIDSGKQTEKVAKIAGLVLLLKLRLIVNEKWYAGKSFVRRNKWESLSSFSCNKNLNWVKILSQRKKLFAEQIVKETFWRTKELTCADNLRSVSFRIT